MSLEKQVMEMTVQPPQIYILSKLISYSFDQIRQKGPALIGHWLTNHCAHSSESMQISWPALVSELIALSPHKMYNQLVFIQSV